VAYPFGLEPTHLSNLAHGQPRACRHHSSSASKKSAPGSIRNLVEIVRVVSPVVRSSWVSSRLVKFEWWFVQRLPATLFPYCDQGPPRLAEKGAGRRYPVQTLAGNILHKYVQGRLREANDWTRLGNRRDARRASQWRRGIRAAEWRARNACRV